MCSLPLQLHSQSQRLATLCSLVRGLREFFRVADGEPAFRGLMLPLLDDLLVFMGQSLQFHGQEGSCAV